jgi:diguanylate cyclase (GGDEF)-like protein
MNEQLANKIRECQNLPTLPSIAMQVLELVQDPDADIPKLARLVSKDPALSSRILKTVNSSLYARPQKISKLTQALTLLGLQTVRVLVLGFSLARNVNNSRHKGFNPLHYWRRSIYSATAALTLAQRAHLEFQEEAFIGALLMDIGMLALDEVFAEEYSKINEKARSHAELLKYEQAAFDTNHAEVAGVLAETWQLPPLLSIPMAFHHSADQVEDPTLRSLAEACYVAGRCADVFVEESAAGAIAEIRGFCLRQYNMSEADCDQFLDQICRRTGEIAPLFDVSVNAGISYESILKKANEQVIQLRSSHQQELHEEWSKLKSQSNTDPQTGLANRGRFEQVLAEQFAASQASGAPLSLLMLDIDQFKEANDQYGQQAGDAILKWVCGRLRTAARPQDLAARVSGDELVLLMPGTARDEAMTTADVLCHELAARPVESGTLLVGMTVSVGVAAMEPGGPFKEPAHLLKAADAALYAARNAGGNCARCFSLAKPATTQPAAA